MSLLGIHHIAIICSDYDTSKAFYCDVLGLEVVAETYREQRDSYMLDLMLPDGTQIELFSFPNPPERVSSPEAQGLRHLAFRSILFIAMWITCNQKASMLNLFV
ncbi:hypothetical protein JCM19233_4387 [Vibrio astriarenae]|nr:hypothetical protein JCM19233_4387 [Vibrio sp. C7]